MYMTPAYILAAFGGLKKNRHYEVAAKNVASKSETEPKILNVESILEDEIKELTNLMI